MHWKSNDILCTGGINFSTHRGYAVVVQKYIDWSPTFETRLFD